MPHKGHTLIFLPGKSSGVLCRVFQVRFLPFSYKEGITYCPFHILQLISFY